MGRGTSHFWEPCRSLSPDRKPPAQLTPVAPLALHSPNSALLSIYNALWGPRHSSIPSETARLNSLWRGARPRKDSHGALSRARQNSAPYASAGVVTEAAFFN